jgi:hypothetical protein
VAISYGDARRGSVELDVLASELGDLAREGAEDRATWPQAEGRELAVRISVRGLRGLLRWGGWAKAMPPSGQYFLASAARQTSASLPPKGMNHGPRSLFPCKTAMFEGAAKGAIMRFVDASGRHPPRLVPP